MDFTRIQLPKYRISPKTEDKHDSMIALKPKLEIICKCTLINASIESLVIYELNHRTFAVVNLRWYFILPKKYFHKYREMIWTISLFENDSRFQL